MTWVRIWDGVARQTNNGGCGHDCSNMSSELCLLYTQQGWLRGEGIMGFRGWEVNHKMLRLKASFDFLLAYMNHETVLSGLPCTVTACKCMRIHNA